MAPLMGRRGGLFVPVAVRGIRYADRRSDGLRDAGADQRRDGDARGSPWTRPLLVDPTSIEDIKRGIVELAGNSELRARLAAAGSGPRGALHMGGRRQPLHEFVLGSRPRRRALAPAPSR